MKTDGITLKYGIFGEPCFYSDAGPIAFVLDLGLKKELENITYKPVIHRDGLLKLTRNADWYTLKDLENRYSRRLCLGSMKLAFGGKHPLEVGQSVKFYLEEI